MSATFWAIVIGLYTIIALAIVISLLLGGVRPSKSLAWLLAIFTIPVGGMFLYLMLGRNRRKRIFKRSMEIPTEHKVQKNTLGLSETNFKISRIISNMTQCYPTEGNQLKFLKDGKATFDAIFEALENSRNFIHLQYYIFEEGELTDRLLELFSRKRQEGVIIRLIYDSIGSYSLSGKYRKKLREIGVETYPFLPLRYGRYLTSLNYRNHRKIIVVDGWTGFTGGINISDKYLKGDPNLGVWHDMHLEIKGSAVADLNKVFLEDWRIVSGKELENFIPDPDENLASDSIVQILADGPDDTFPTVEQLFLSIINSAYRYIYITNPYIIPSLPVQRALENAALSGVDVRLLISEKGDSKLVTWCVSSYFQALLESGIRIYLYPKGFLHSKIIVSDDEVSTIGTANLDERSFRQNYEINAVLFDTKISIELRNDFLQDCRSSVELDINTFRERPWTDRLKQGAARMLSPLL